MKEDDEEVSDQENPTSLYPCSVLFFFLLPRFGEIMKSIMQIWQQTNCLYIIRNTCDLLVRTVTATCALYLPRLISMP